MDAPQVRRLARRSADFIRQLLAFARKQTIAPKQLDLNDAIQGMLKMMRRLIGEDVVVSLPLSNDIGRVYMDPTHVDQILANLLVNARDAISDNGRIVMETSNVSANEGNTRENLEAALGEYVLLAVEDNGCGIEQDALDRIFEPFHTTKSVGTGTGLGLSTVYGIVKQNNGLLL